MEALKAAFAACRDQRLAYLKVVSVKDYLDSIPAFYFPTIGQTLVSISYVIVTVEMICFYADDLNCFSHVPSCQQLETDFKYLQPKVDNCALLKGLNEHTEAIHLEATSYLKKLKGTAKTLLQNVLQYYNSTGMCA